MKINAQTQTEERTQFNKTKQSNTKTNKIHYYKIQNKIKQQNRE